MVQEKELGLERGRDGEEGTGAGEEEGKVGREMEMEERRKAGTQERGRKRGGKERERERGSLKQTTGPDIGAPQRSQRGMSRSLWI